MENNTELVNQLTSLSAGLPPPLQREVSMVVHKIVYPMVEILAKVPGDSLTERAKRLKVSRQTMYVWLSEKFRPTRVQAKRIARVTGVPIEHIVDDGFEDDDTRKKARKKASVLAGKRKKPATSSRSTAHKGRGKAPARKRVAKAGNLHSATG